MSQQIKLEISPTPEALAESTLLFIEKECRQAEKEGRVFRVAFSGGTTPKRLFALIEKKAQSGDAFLKNAEIFFVDDRWVPEGHKDNNGTMAWHYFKNSGIPKAHFHPIPTSGETPEADAALYQQLLERNYGQKTLSAEKPLFDLVMLGLGSDGHTASLFPETPVLEEKTAWVGVSQPKEAPHQRITLTYPAIESAQNVVFLVEGSGKKEMLSRLLKGDKTIPAGNVCTKGHLFAMADIEAAAAL